MKVNFYGDIHGNVAELEYQIDNRLADLNVQVGDFGYGWFTPQQEEYIESISNKFRFIRGNHDDPARCRAQKNYLGDFSISGLGKSKVMFVSGAWSIDYYLRTPGASWWFDEELNPEQFENAIALYQDFRPDVMVTHDAPINVTDEMFIKTGLAMGGQNAKQIPNRTNIALQEMFDFHKPRLWVYGHWHRTQEKVIDGCKFVCVGENDVHGEDL